MISPEPLWSCLLPIPGSDWSVTKLRLLGKYVLGIQDDLWFCRDSSDGSLLWERKIKGRPNTIKGLYGDVIVATEYRCDSPFSANYGIYGISLMTQQLLWTSHAPGRWGRFARLLDFIPDFTNEFRDDPQVVKNGQIWTQGGRIIDAITGTDIGKIEWTPELKRSVTEPTLNLKFEKYQECGETGTLHAGIPGQQELAHTFDGSKPVQLYLRDNAGQVVWTFDASQIGEIGEPSYSGLSLRYIEPYVYLVVSDRPRRAITPSGQKTRDNPAQFNLWTLDVRSGQIIQKVPLNQESAIFCSIVDVDETRLLINCKHADKGEMLVLCFTRMKAENDQSGAKKQAERRDMESNASVWPPPPIAH